MDHKAIDEAVSVYRADLESLFRKHPFTQEIGVAVHSLLVAVTTPNLMHKTACIRVIEDLYLKEYRAEQKRQEHDHGGVV